MSYRAVWDGRGEPFGLSRPCLTARVFASAVCLSSRKARVMKEGLRDMRDARELPLWFYAVSNALFYNSANIHLEHAICSHVLARVLLSLTVQLEWLTQNPSHERHDQERPMSSPRPSQTARYDMGRCSRMPDACWPRAVPCRA